MSAVTSFRKLVLNVGYGIYRRLPLLRHIYRPARRLVARRQLARRIRSLRERHARCRVVIGANKKCQAGWIPSEFYTLDVRDPADWQQYFHRESVDALVAEHVWEHLSIDDGQAAARLCLAYLKPGGHLRIAVPDGLFPDPSYIEFVEPGGSGPSAWDHRVLFTYRILGAALEEVGFEVELLEYYDEDGAFHEKEWDPDDGRIERSARLQKPGVRTFGGLPYTSLIVDAHKRTT